MDFRPGSTLRLRAVRFARRVTLLLALGTAAWLAHADYPERSVRMVVGLQAGASTDTLARLVAQKLGERLGQPFVIENKPGAATRIGMESMSKAPADGYTLGVANAVTTSFPLMFDSFPFVAGKDFVPITLLGRAPSFLAVRASLPVHNVQEFVAYAKAHNGKMSYGQGGNGSNPHLAALTLVKSLGIQAVEVAYKGNAPTAVAVAGGEVDFAILEYQAVRPLVEAGKLRLLAVTEPERSVLVPSIPTSGEQGLTRKLDGMTPWFMLLAPAGTPAPVVALLNRHVNEVLKNPEVKKAMLAAGIEIAGSSSEQALAYFQQQREQVARLAREMNLSFKN
ncbi:tripartite tricarboxylate transporter substrate binding protein [Acidovorax sp. Be4]|uniref:Tripartite tricarboxylate transporter substrate binding protein n=1 Tax=Acidovorax bellezanensis TaxID=2976702 RepID=A0ABT2PMY9_9BURK|nr:tripartite tricarboxylate transporter substrate binding protein [Acidovorax sp. Be4]MCT9811189.1 tripartite tricarboxylate transporter substrate binding protein [Acidovorax sp. Be4]